MIKELVTKASEIKAKEPSFYCKEWLPIPKNTLTMISAPGGTGKSFLSIQLAIRIIAENPNSRILLWLSEDPLYLTKDRINKIFNRITPHLIDKADEILNNIDIIGAEQPTIYFQSLNQNQLKTLGDELVANYNVVILDPLIAFYAGEENSNSQARAFMNILNRIAQERLLSIVLIHHHNKNGESKTRGASAFVDAVRLLYSVSTIKDKETKEIHPTKRKITIEKDNWGVRMLLNTNEFEREILPYSVREINTNGEKGQQQVKEEEIEDIMGAVL
jgi:replicative DNA helicase